jgi:uncharacterized phiE125 gp8 family phage protein
VSRLIVWSDSQITPPTALPFDVSWAKDHVRSIDSREDLLIESWIRAATQYFEEITGRQVMTATWEAYLDATPLDTRIELPHPPLQEVLSVDYLSGDDYVAFTDGASPEVALWQSYAPQGAHAKRGWVELKTGQTWPVVTTSAQAIRIRYTAGYGDAEADVPDLVKAAILLMVANFEQFRSEVHLSERSSKLEQLPFGMQQIIRGFLWSAASTQQLRTLL